MHFVDFMRIWQPKCVRCDNETHPCKGFLDRKVHVLQLAKLEAALVGKCRSKKKKQAISLLY